MKPGGLEAVILLVATLQPTCTVGYRKLRGLAVTSKSTDKPVLLGAERQRLVSCGRQVNTKRLGGLPDLLMAAEVPHLAVRIVGCQAFRSSLSRAASASASCACSLQPSASMGTPVPLEC